MEGKLIGTVVIIVVILILFIFSWWIYNLKKPETGLNCRNLSDWVWNENCLYFEEKFYDSSLKSPQNLRLSLTNFKYAEGGGPPIFLPMWYRFRYVNVKSGGYSDFSQWTLGPVISGSCCLPCVEGLGNCSSIEQGFESCSFNQPTIGISSSDSQYNPTELVNGSYIYINVHRYVNTNPNDFNPPPQTIEDKIIGILKPGSFIGNQQYYEWTDILFNPCSKGCTVPKWCNTEVRCTKPCK